MADDLNAFASAVTFAVLYQLTPLQRSEADEFLEKYNHEPRDLELVERQRKVIEEHYKHLEGNFLSSYVRKHFMNEIACAFWCMIALDYEGEPRLDFVPCAKHIKAHGNATQRQQAMEEFYIVDESTLNETISDALDLTLPEMYITKDHFMRRAQAACTNSSLIIELQTTGKWTQLQELLANDRAAAVNLGVYLEKGSNFSEKDVAQIATPTLIEIDRLLKHAASQLAGLGSSIGDSANQNNRVKKRPTASRVADLFRAMHIRRRNSNGHGEGDVTKPLLDKDQSKEKV